MSTINYYDRVKDTSVSTLTGNFTLANSAPSGFRTFDAAAGHAGNHFPYVIDGGANVEVGYGHLSDAVTLVRDTVLYSTNGNALVSFPAGTKTVFIDVPADMAQKYIASDGSTGQDIDITTPDGVTFIAADYVILGASGGKVDLETQYAAIGDVQGEGNGTLIVVNDSGETIDITAANGITLNGSAIGGGPKTVVAKTANFAITAADNGKCFSLTGGQWTATFDASLPIGFYAEIVQTESYGFIVAFSGGEATYGNTVGEDAGSVTCDFPNMDITFTKVRSGHWSNSVGGVGLTTT